MVAPEPGLNELGIDTSPGNPALQRLRYMGHRHFPDLLCIYRGKGAGYIASFTRTVSHYYHIIERFTAHFHGNGNLRLVFQFNFLCGIANKAKYQGFSSFFDQQPF